jgi:hypothetical protein
MLFVRTMMHTGILGNCRRYVTVALVSFFACLSLSRAGNAHPSEMICPGTFTGSSAPFELCWSSYNSNETANWTAYITFSVYNSAGTLVSGPTEDMTAYSSAEQEQSGGCPSSFSQTGAETVNNPPANGTVVLSFVGEWNNGQCTVPTFAASSPSSCTVAFTGDKIPVGSNKYTIPLAVVNIAKQGSSNSTLQFVYTLYTKTTPDGPISRGTGHVVSQLKPTSGSALYSIPPSAAPGIPAADNPTTINDLQIDLSQVTSGYVYLDVFPVDSTPPAIAGAPTTIIPLQGLRMQVYP